MADLRAPTPTAAAELAVPDQGELRSGLDELGTRLARAIQGYLSEQRWKMENLLGEITRLSPVGEINSGRQRLDELSSRLERAIAVYLKGSQETCKSFLARLSALNPESILKRGYAVVTAEDGSTIYRVGQVSTGEQLQVRVSDGEFEVIVE